MIWKENFIFNSTKEFRYVSGIYKISHNVDNRIYVGSAKKFWGRFCRHINKLKTGEHKNLYLQNFHDKYPNAIFTFDLIEFVPDLTKLVEREQFWLDETKCYEHDIGFNICPKAQSAIGVKRRPDFIAKLTGKNNPMYGRKHTPKELKAISDASKGNQHWKFRKPCSPELKEKMIAHFRKPIILIHPEDDSLVKEYRSAKEASDELRLHAPSITAVCKNKKKHIKGYKFIYKSEYLTQNPYIPQISLPPL